MPGAVAESARGSDGFGLPVTAQVGAAGFAGGFHLFVGPDVGLRGLHVLPGAGNLPFVTFNESLVHTLDYTCGKLDPYELRWILMILAASLAYGQAVVIRNATLLDGNGHVLKDTYLVIEGRRIARFTER